MTPKAFHALFGRIDLRAKLPFPIHPHMLRRGYALLHRAYSAAARRMAWIDRARIEVAKTAAQRLDQVWNGGWREIADTPRQFLLLRVHRERPPEKQVRQRTMQRRVPSLLRLPWQIDGR